MSETVGRVDFMAALDGSNAVRESRALGEKIGQEGDKAGAGFGDRFDRELTPRMRATADKAGAALADGLKLDGTILNRNRSDIEKFARSTSGEFRKMSLETREAFAQMFPDVDRVLERMNVRFRETWDNLDTGSARLDGMNVKWKDLSHNTRQWTLIVSAVLASMQDLSVLSSAAGAGLLAVGGGLSAAVLGAGAAAAVFAVLAKDIGDLPPGLRDAAGEFKELGRQLTTTRDIIASAAIQQMPNTFSRLTESVKGLDPVFARLGSSVGTVFNDFSRGISVGSDGFRELEGLIDNAAGDFPKLASAAGTWSVGLLRGLNKANPMVDQLIGYVELLGERFDRFTRSSSFDQWIATSMQTFTEFGELLDATGRALNDLVTPAATVRTQEFLNNLTEFMPNLSALLDVLGRVNVFGLAAQALNEFGQALSPLAGPAGELADSINEIATIVISKLAGALRIAAEVVEPLAQGLANVIDAIPEPALDALATGVIAVASAFVVLKGVQGVAGAMGALGLFTTSAAAAEGAAGKLATGLKSGLGKAGAVGLAVVGVAALSSALVEAMEKMYGLDDAARNAVAGQDSLADAMKNVYVGGKDLTQNLDDVVNRMGDLDNFFVYISALDDVGGEAVQLATSLQKLSPQLAQLANQDMEKATSQFAAWAEELGASDEQVLSMLENMPEFKQALLDAASAAGTQLDSQALVAAALGESKIGIDGNISSLTGMTTSAYLTGTEIDALSAKIRNFGTANLDARSAARNYEETLDQLTQSIVDNGLTLDITTEKGRANEALLDQLAVSTLEYASATVKQTGDQGAANIVIGQGREQLIKMLGQFGITGAKAEEYADKLGLIPTQVSTTIRANGLADAYNTTGNLQYRLESINGSVYSYTMRGTYIQVGNREVKATEFARGGTVNGAQHAIVGEAGPEAIVPLRRPLGQVDPSVRWLSAIAQGMSAPKMAGGGIMGRPSTTVVFEAGAIVVEGADDPRQTAYDVLDVVAENIGS